MLLWSPQQTNLMVREIIMRLRVALAVIWTIVIMVLCWTPQAFLPVSEAPNSLAMKLYLDKIIHAGMFMIFGVLWLRAGLLSKRRYLWVFLAGVALAAITEIVQNVPSLNREGEFEDVLADVAGVMIGFLLYWMKQRLTGRKVSS